MFGVFVRVVMLLFFLVLVYGVAVPSLVSAKSTALVLGGFVLLFSGIWWAYKFLCEILDRIHSLKS